MLFPVLLPSFFSAFPPAKKRSISVWRMIFHYRMDCRLRLKVWPDRKFFINDDAFPFRSEWWDEKEKKEKKKFFFQVVAIKLLRGISCEKHREGTVARMSLQSDWKTRSDFLLLLTHLSSVWILSQPSNSWQILETSKTINQGASDKSR